MSAINAVDAAFRGEWSQLVATLVRDLGDLSLAEDVASEAFVEASSRWHRDGIPRRPGAWLLTTARRKAIDRIRRDRRFDDRREELTRLAEDPPEVPAEKLLDDQLALIFGCCHPALAPDAQVALTLRYVAGLSTAQIARAFLVPEATMAKRLVRAKRKISAAAVPIEIPERDRIAERLTAVCGVVYAVFTEGHASASGTALLRGSLCDEALFLADTLVELLPDAPQVRELRALCRLTDARRATRVDDDGLPVLLRDQDRSRWDRSKIEGGLADLATAHALTSGGSASPYGPMAMLAGVHAAAPCYESTNWTAIVAVYDTMIRRDPNPVLALNRAAAIAERDGPEAGLAAIDAADPHGALATYHYLHGARADLLARLDRTEEAVAAYTAAIECCDNDAERRWLESRRAELT
ncbi:MAG: sigma-70 family RNA polymerase sigma factor [Actinomycetota bacterium]